MLIATLTTHHDRNRAIDLKTHADDVRRGRDSCPNLPVRVDAANGKIDKRSEVFRRRRNLLTPNQISKCAVSNDDVAPAQPSEQQIRQL